MQLLFVQLQFRFGAAVQENGFRGQRSGGRSGTRKARMRLLPESRGCGKGEPEGTGYREKAGLQPRFYNGSTGTPP
jgi:hypothetical protein